MAAAAAQQQQPNAQPWAGDETQWRVVWTAPNEADEEDVIIGFGAAWAIAVAPARIENDGIWLMPDRAHVWDAFAVFDAISMEVATHDDGRRVRLTRL